MAASQLLCRAFVLTLSSAVKDEGKNRCSGFSASETVITSLSNPFVKHCVKLRLSSSYRHSNSTALVVGFTPISEILRFEEKNRRGVNIDRSFSLVECLMLLEEAEVPMEYCRGGEDACLNVVRVSREVMRKVSGFKSVDSTEAIAVLRIPRSFVSLEGAESTCYLNRFGSKPHRILVLDGIQDPGNLGTLLRSAISFKWVPLGREIRLDEVMDCIQSLRKGSNSWRLLWTLLGTCGRRGTRWRAGESRTKEKVAEAILKDYKLCFVPKSTPLDMGTLETTTMNNGLDNFIFSVFLVCTPPRGQCLFLNSACL